MKSWISKTAIAIAMLAVLPALAHADTWQIDPAHTNVEFTVRHMMISNVKGQFQKTSGTITTVAATRPRHKSMRPSTRRRSTPASTGATLI